MNPLSAVRFQPVSPAYRAMHAPQAPRFASTDPAETPLKPTMDMYEFVDLAVQTPALLRTHRQYLRDALKTVNITEVMRRDGRAVGMQFLQLTRALDLTARRATPANIVVTVNDIKSDTEALNRIITTALHTYSQTDEGAVYRVMPGETGNWSNDTGKALGDAFNQQLVSPLHLLPLDRQKHFLHLARQANPGHPVLEPLTPQSLTLPVSQPFNAHLEANRQGEPDGLVGVLPHLAVKRFVYPSVDEASASTIRLPVRTMTLVHGDDEKVFPPQHYKPGKTPLTSPQSIKNAATINTMIETMEAQKTQWITFVTPLTWIDMKHKVWFPSFNARSVQAASA